MSQTLYLIFNKTHDHLIMLSASLYKEINGLGEGILDFHRVYVFLNYEFFLDVLKD